MAKTIPRKTMKNSVVYICGTAKTTRHLVDWERKDADFWVFNESAFVGSDSTRWTADKPISGVFQIHHPYIWRSDNGGHYPGYYQWLQEHHPFTIWMQERYSDVPASAAYPLAEVAGLLANLRRGERVIDNFFTSSAAYALALAIYLGYEEIHITGIEMASGTEYATQRDGVTFWIGVAIARGIRVVLLEESRLMDVKLYGYTGEIVIGRQKFEMAAHVFEKRMAELQASLFEAQGAVKTSLNALGQSKTQEEADRLQKIFIDALNKAQEATFEYGAVSGKLQENNRYMTECDELIRAAGGQHAAEVLASVSSVSAVTAEAV